jgi:glycosyltransferase involved in cell wall biosynthesis
MEWANALTSYKKRPKQVLKNILGQMQELKQTGELIIMCSQNTKIKAVERLVQNIKKGGDVRIISSQFKNQYILKNEGMRYALGEIIIFIDSDLIIEPGCIKTLLLSFKRKKVEIVSGAVHSDTSNIYDKAMALTWLFPLRSPDGEMYPDNKYNPSIVAAKRQIWEKYPFPKDRVLGCGSLVELADPMIQDGITIWHQPLVRVSHPTPSSFKRFLLRAMADGLDNTLSWRRYHNVFISFIYLCAWFSIYGIIRNIRIIKYHKKVQMSYPLIPLAWIINTTYYGIAWIGGLLGLFNKRIAMRICTK